MLKCVDFFGGGWVIEKDQFIILFYLYVEGVNKETNEVFEYHLKCF